MSPTGVQSARDLGRRPACSEAIQCVGVLAEALGPETEAHIEVLLQPMILTGLSDVLVKALLKVSKALPTLLPSIQRLLLESVIIALPRRPQPDYSYPYVQGPTNGSGTLPSPTSYYTVHTPLLFECGTVKTTGSGEQSRALTNADFYIN